MAVLAREAGLLSDNVLKRPMTNISVAQPDVSLLLDLDGIIREVTFSNVAIAQERVEDWIGRPWVDTVDELLGDRVRRIVDEARTGGISAFRQITQRFPSGLELPMEYTTVLLGGRAGLLTVGKNLQAVAELQSRLIAAQQTMERDYWKIRDVETRYRMLFDASNEAILVVRAANLRVVEANPAAAQAFDLPPNRLDSVTGRELLAQLAPSDREPFQAMLSRVREHSKAPAIRVLLGREAKPWLIRATMMTSESGLVFLLQLTSAELPIAAARSQSAPDISVLAERLPDGFVIIDRLGTIRFANQAFLDLAQIHSKATLIGEKLGRWLWRPGADLTALLSNVMNHQAVRLFSTTVHGELGTDCDVEVSAVGNADGDPEYIGLVVRDVTRRLKSTAGEDRLSAALKAVTEQIGHTPLRKLVSGTVAVVEQHYVKAALDIANGNRTAAAEILGLSRQSLYAKLDRYGIEDAAPAIDSPVDGDQAAGHDDSIENEELSRGKRRG